MAEGNTDGCAIASIGWTLRSLRPAGMHGNSTRENRETPWARRGRSDSGPVGEGHEPGVQHARRWGVGRLRTTVEVSEQWWATAGGGHGGKAIDKGERRAGD